MVFSNRRHTDLKQLYHIRSGTIYFGVPKGRHTGTDNYLMLHLLSYIREQNTLNPEKRLQVKVKVINSSGRFFPHHDSLETYFRELLVEAGIEVIYNVDIQKVDVETRTLTLSDSTQSQYAAYYQYLPLVEPDNLAVSIQDSTNIDKHTLRHNKYSNIYILGNAEAPTTHSYYATNYQINAVRESLAGTLLKTRTMGKYDGSTAIPLWRTHKHVNYHGQNYEAIRSYDGIGKKPWVGRLLALDRLYMGKFQVDNYYKYKHYGLPFYYKRGRGTIVEDKPKTHEEFSVDRKISK